MPFEPPKYAPVEYRWATYIKSRKPQFKIHRQKRHATGALSQRKYQPDWYAHKARGTEEVIIYELVDGEWVEREKWEHAAA